MEETLAAHYLTKAGYKLDKVLSIPEGGSHYSFSVQLRDGEECIVRFEKKKRIDSEGKKRDIHYNGVLSLEREAYLCTLVREKVHLPAPQIKELHRIPGVSFLLVEKMPGIHWKTFLEEKKYSLQDYLSSLKFLGADIADAQRVKFPSYGNVMENGVIEPPHVLNFAERLREITSLRLQRIEEKNILNIKEFQEVEQPFHKTIEEIAEESNQSTSPVLILTDIRPMNFFVNEDGKPSGYFDLEFCQAGHPALEFYNMGLQLFNYFNQNIFEQAQKAFFEGYRANGGQSVHNDSNKELEDFLSLGHILSAVEGYYNIKDGLRDTWSQRFKDLLFKIMNANKVDYAGFADIVREKTKQPRNPTLP